MKLHLKPQISCSCIREKRTKKRTKSASQNDLHKAFPMQAGILCRIYDFFFAHAFCIAMPMQTIRYLIFSRFYCRLDASPQSDQYKNASELDFQNFIAFLMKIFFFLIYGKTKFTLYCMSTCCGHRMYRLSELTSLLLGNRSSNE